jgi:RimJ/RimL family protein N-acetyltransferase
MNFETGLNEPTYIKTLVKKNARALDYPASYRGSFYEGTWYIIEVNGAKCGAIGFTKYRGVHYLQVVLEEEFRGAGLFQEAFFLLLDLHPKIKSFRLTTLKENHRMQRAAHKAGFEFLGTITSLNNTGNEMYLYEYKK